MGWLDWLTRPDAGRTAWHDAFRETASRPTRAGADALRARLAALALPPDDEEVEQEMLDGLEAVLALEERAASIGLPRIGTGHRVVGTDECHFIAPAVLLSDERQPAGTLLLTSTRAIFTGAGGASATPWLAVAAVVRGRREVRLVSDGGFARAVHLRLNTHRDAMTAVWIAHQLASRRHV